MGLRILRLFLAFFILAGCATVKKNDQSLYEQGYREGVKENLHTYMQNFQGGDFPYYNWAGPTIQDVDMPARIVNGVFIPAHKEPVIIKPGEWRKDYGYPIQGRRESNEKTVIEYHDANVADITVVPQQYRGAGGGAGNGTENANR